MVEFSKIVKKKSVEPPRPARPVFEEPKPVAQPPPPETPSQEGAGTQAESSPTFQEAPVRIDRIDPGDSRALEEPTKVPLEDTKPLYEKMFGLARRIFVKDANPEAIDPNELIGTVTEAAGAIIAGDARLTELSLVSPCPDEESTLFQHTVNTCILSLVIGQGFNYEMEKLIELGITAFLHDIGMTVFEDMSKLPRKLTPQEYEEIKQHVEVGDRLLKRIRGGLAESILVAQKEIHERMDGSGYPKGKKNIHEYARIIALADGFESMIHPRPFRPRYSVTDVYRRILDAKNKFDPVFIKILVDKIGFFPNGCLVQLNTGEICKVIRQNPRSPLRPAVEVLYNPDGMRLDEGSVKEVNLVKLPTLHVKRCFLEGSDKADDESVS